MRKITELIIHHSATSINQDFKKSIQSFNYNHKERIHFTINSKGYYIAYHHVIGANEELQTRGLHEIGGGTRSLVANQRSIQICLIGSFENGMPTAYQKQRLKELCLYYQLKYDIEYIRGHSYYQPSRICPGRNVLKLIPNLYLMNQLDFTEESAKVFAPYMRKLRKDGTLKENKKLHNVVQWGALFKFIALQNERIEKLETKLGIEK